MTTYPFQLDAFQLEAIAHLDAGRSVLVAAPTGSGKTVVAEHAVDLALERGGKVFYTTPIKALSNQKYQDLAERLGTDRVGLLTGDNSINGEAPVVVMTTEVLRNMLYAGSPTLRGLAYVVLDEVHYLQDRYRGPVWEEVIVHTPEHVRFVCLSATVSNADELARWLTSVRGPTALVFHEQRPVPLENLYLVGDHSSVEPHLLPVLVDGEPNPEGGRFDAETNRSGRGRAQRRPRRRFFTPSRLELLDRLQADHLLPAIVFVFSRAGCDDAVTALVNGGVDLTSPTEREQIRAIVEERTAVLVPSERQILGHSRFLHALERGVASHHAGLVPAFKEAVEAAFAAGLVKVVFATETLALGINMPARATVIERLTKFNGDTHEFLTPLEYTQLTGRAGRRGIDTVGSAMVLWSPWVRFEQIAALASSRSFPLRSVFRPTYNMAANLVRAHDRAGAHRLLNLSFAQFQSDADIVDLEARSERERRALAGAVDRAQCSRGDVFAYLERTGDQLSAPSNGTEAALAALQPGQVIAVPTEQGNEPGVVLSVSFRSGGRIKVRTVTRSHKSLTVGVRDFAEPPMVVGRIELPQPYQPNSGAFQHEVVSRLHRARLRKGKRGRSRSGSEAPGPADGNQPTNGVADCPDLADHVRAAREVLRRRATIDRLTRRRATRSTHLAAQFDDIVGVLQLHGYVAEWDLTAAGRLLTSIFHESDLAIAEAVRTGLFDGLDAPELAALLSCFTYEHRGRGPSVSPRLRSRNLRERFHQAEQLVADLRDTERQGGLPLTRELDPGFAALAAGWAAGDPLDTIIDPEELTGGDFVRQARQLVDVLRQLAGCATDPDTARAARDAARAVQRGVVAGSSTIDVVAAGQPAHGTGDHGDRQG